MISIWGFPLGVAIWPWLLLGVAIWLWFPRCPFSNESVLDGCETKVMRGRWGWSLVEKKCCWRGRTVSTSVNSTTKHCSFYHCGTLYYYMDTTISQLFTVMTDRRKRYHRYLELLMPCLPEQSRAKDGMKFALNEAQNSDSTSRARTHIKFTTGQKFSGRSLERSTHVVQL